MCLNVVWLSGRRLNTNKLSRRKVQIDLHIEIIHFPTIDAGYSNALHTAYKNHSFTKNDFYPASFRQL